jgi:hypothetical protein
MYFGYQISTKDYFNVKNAVHGPMRHAALLTSDGLTGIMVAAGPDRPTG